LHACIVGVIPSSGGSQVKKHFQYWGALYILFALFLGSLIGHYVYQVVVAGESFAQFMSAVFENWQSEWIQLFVQALLIEGLGHVLYQKKTEDQERMERKLNQILTTLERHSTR
jgi:amino acid permease